MAAWKRIVMAVMVMAAAASVWAHVKEEPARAVQMVRVARGEVHCVAALTGRVDYADAHGAYASWPGLVAEVCVAPGQRVTAGQALVRLQDDAADHLAAAWAAQGTLQGRDAVRGILDGTVIRAPRNAMVRQVMATADAPVQAGEPVALLSGSQQIIRCVAAERDAREVCCGMQATLLVDGEAVGTAEVTQVDAVTADEATGRMVRSVTLTVDGSVALPQGAQVVAEVTLHRRENVPVLPVEAVTARETLWWVHDGICTEIPAEIVLSDEMHAWVDLPEGIAVAVGEFTEGERVREAAP